MFLDLKNLQKDMLQASNVWKLIIFLQITSFGGHFEFSNFSGIKRHHT